MKRRSEATQTLRAGCSKADPQTNKHTHRQGRLQYTAQLSAQCNNDTQHSCKAPRRSQWIWGYYDWRRRPWRRFLVTIYIQHFGGSEAGPMESPYSAGLMTLIFTQVPNTLLQFLREFFAGIIVCILRH